MNLRTQIALALWIIVGAAAIVVFGTLPSKVSGYQDFKPYYVGALALREGINPYEGDFGTVFTEAGRPLSNLSVWERAEPLLDTPAWLIFFEPFTLLEPATAYWAWAAFNLLCLGAALFLLIREIGPPGADGWTVAALMLLYPPIAINFWFAQSEVVLLLIFVLALRALGRRHDGAAGVILAAAALLRAYPLGMLGYLVARRNWRATVYFVAVCVIGSALAVALAGLRPVASFVRLAAPTSGTHIGGVLAGLLRHPANLNLGSFVQLVLGYRGWAPAAGLAVELLLAGFAFAATAALEDDPYGCGFSLWLVVVTMLSPVAWPQFLVCVVPLYVGIAAANHASNHPANHITALPRRVLNAAGASYVAALFMGGPLGFLSPALARSIAGHVHASYVLPAEAAFISLGCAYFAALWMTIAGAAPRAARARVQPARVKGGGAEGSRARLELGRDL
ncbi:MAG TPA: glycosyltransferase family 87 protein [Candidatus Binataceae bacterium]|nr:glycosyltransferase family 87 protein [Candidatus Binataceae bacterium]